MKKMTKITTLLLALMTVLMMSQAAFAENTPVQGGTYTYNGSEIVTSNVPDLEAEISGMEPGDSITITQTYVNESDNETNWYLRNNIIETLEASEDLDGGYSYKLVSGGETLFDSDAVGGLDSESSQEGLKQINDAITGDDEDSGDVSGAKWIQIDRLKAGGRGTTTLTVTLDGESQTNVYENRLGELDIQYAVEDIENEDIVVYKRVPNTGDDTNLMLPIAIFLGALLLLILAILSYRKDRKDGEEA